MMSLTAHLKLLFSSYALLCTFTFWNLQYFLITLLRVYAMHNVLSVFTKGRPSYVSKLFDLIRRSNIFASLNCQLLFSLLYLLASFVIIKLIYTRFSIFPESRNCPWHKTMTFTQENNSDIFHFILYNSYRSLLF